MARKKITMTEEQRKLVARGMHTVWSEIRADVGPASAGERVELALDAGRMAQVDREADDAVEALIKEHGYPAVHKYLTGLRLI